VKGKRYKVKGGAPNPKPKTPNPKLQTQNLKKPSTLNLSMALSRIWSAFIIVAVLVATIRIVGTDNKVLFSAMVTGKSGDTIKLHKVDTTVLSAAQLQQLDSLKTIPQGNEQVMRTGDGKLQYFQIQGADGIIETCKSAVTIAIGLIGIMALFMGFMSIAERAGGIRLLSKIIGPFFQNYFPSCQKITRLWAT